MYTKRDKYINDFLAKEINSNWFKMNSVKFAIDGINCVKYLVVHKGAIGFVITKHKMLLDAKNSEIFEEHKGLWGKVAPELPYEDCINTEVTVPFVVGTKLIKIKSLGDEKCYYFNEKYYRLCVKHWEGSLKLIPVKLDDTAYATLYGLDDFGEIEWVLLGVNVKNGRYDEKENEDGNKNKF